MSQQNDSESENETALEKHLLDLPREVAPPRDLWNGIEARIAAKRRQRTLARRTIGGVSGVLALAAAIAFVVHGSNGGPRVVDPSAPIASEAPAPSAAPAPVASNVPNEESADEPLPFIPEEASYRAALAALDVTFQQSAKQLPPKDVAAVTASLTAIDKALAVTRASLADRPDDAPLRAELDAEYEQKIDAMNEVLAWTTRS